MPTQWTIPGSTLTIQRCDAQLVEGMFQSMFLTGGLTLSQVSGITGLEPYAVQNWVKRGFLSPPLRKRYTMDQTCRILTINTFKSVLPMERICSLLSYVNGHLDSSHDDIIRDSELYFLFVRLAAQAREIKDAQEAADLIDSYLSGYQGPHSDSRHRVAKALRVMLIAWLAARMRQETELILDEIAKEAM